MKWDGRNNNGEKLANGNYTYKVEAVGADGNQVDVKSTIRGTVYSFRLEEGVPYLIDSFEIRDKNKKHQKREREMPMGGDFIRFE